MKYIVVGATGLVGQAMVRCLLNAGVTPNRIVCLASERSAGKCIQNSGHEFQVQALSAWQFDDTQIALFSAGGSVSRKWVPLATAAGTIVVDNSSVFRLDPDVPLVVPEVNPEAIKQGLERRLIANPNCSTIQLVIALSPIDKQYGISALNVNTYQAISGAGARAVSVFEEGLLNQESGVLDCTPSIDVMTDNLYTKEENKVLFETRKILSKPTLPVNVTAVRVPVITGHSEAVSLYCEKAITPEACESLLGHSPGIKLHTGTTFKTAGQLQADDSLVHVGRVRQILGTPNGINMWVVANNLLKGAAYNSVQIVMQLTNILVSKPLGA